jgi:hypothetical protein
MELLRHLMLSDGFLPHGYCYLCTPGLVELHVISDALIAISYLTIPVTLAYFIRKRHDIPFSWMFLCFGAFIVPCGGTHQPVDFDQFRETVRTLGLYWLLVNQAPPLQTLNTHAARSE